jgi:hypothetical protein
MSSSENGAEDPKFDEREKIEDWEKSGRMAVDFPEMAGISSTRSWLAFEVDMTESLGSRMCRLH